MLLRLLNVLIFILLTFTISCGGLDSSEYEAVVEFKLFSGNSEITSFPSSTFSNEFNQNYNVTKFKMLISDVFLTSTAPSSGLLAPQHVEEEILPTDKRIAETHFYDFSDSATHSLSLKGLDLADGRFKYLTFRFGLLKEDNTEGALPEYEAFKWGMMGGGYHYMQFEGCYGDEANSSCDVSSATKKFKLHAGPTMGMDYSFVVTIPIKTSVVDGKSTYEIKIDVDKFFSNDLNMDYDDISKLMMDAQAQGFMQTNGQNVFSLNN